MKEYIASHSESDKGNYHEALAMKENIASQWIPGHLSAQVWKKTAYTYEMPIIL